jgi:hypothetical protein
MIALVAGSKDKLALGRHTKIAGTIADLHLTLTDNVIGSRPSERFHQPTEADRDPGLA